MATLNLSFYDYKGILAVTKVIWATYFIHGFWQPYNLSNLDPLCLSWLNSIFQAININEFKQGVDLP